MFLAAAQDGNEAIFETSGPHPADQHHKGGGLQQAVIVLDVSPGAALWLVPPS